MKARRLIDILHVSKAERYALLAEGLGLLAEHVSTLRDDLVHLQEAGRNRGAAVVDGLASEEAAKMLIILDVVRMGWEDADAVQRQIRRFSNHLARGIYARVIDGRPADLAEVRRYTETLRQTLYLDGPNDVDWIFRNRVEADREERLYVDYVTNEGESTWISPATASDLYLSNWPSMVIDLALALHRFGCSTEEGLRIVADEWAGVAVTDETHWSVVMQANKKILTRLEASGLRQVGPAHDVQLAMQHWTFPLGGLDLRPIEVENAALVAQRESRIAQEW